MPTLIKWETEDSVLLMPGTADSNADLKAIATGEEVISAAIDNRDGHQYIDFMLSAHLNAAAASSVELWMLKSIDGGTIYELGSVSGDRVGVDPVRPADWSFPLASSADIQHVASAKLLAPSCHFMVYLKWTAGSADGGDSQNMLRYQFSNDEIQNA
jgi:hypothetical protein